MFGKRLKKVAATYFGSMQKLSEVSGINYTQLNNYVNGQRQPAYEALASLSNVGINVDFLMTGEGEMMKDVNVDAELLSDIENFQVNMISLNNKIDLFLRSKYEGHAAAGRLPKEDEGTNDKKPKKTKKNKDNNEEKDE